MLLPPDRIQGLRRGNPAQFIAYLTKKGAQGPYREWVETVYHLCTRQNINIDPIIICFQADMETQSFTSADWFAGNSTGLTIVTDPLVADGEAAALLHVATMWMVLGRSVFPKPLQPIRYKLAPKWVNFMLAEVAQDTRNHGRPVVERLEDLALRYAIRPGSYRYIWAQPMGQPNNPNYANQIAARALLSGLHIPNQAYLHKVKPFLSPKIVRATYKTPIHEGPHNGNRIIGMLHPGQQVATTGMTTGHAARGIPHWYVTDGPLYGYVHSYGMVEV